MLGGMGMLLKSMGLDPDMVEKTMTMFVAEASAMREEIMRQGRVMDALAKSQGLNPADYAQPTTKEIDQ